MPKTRSEAESGGELSGRKPKRQKRAIGHEEANTAAEEPRASLAVPKGMQKRESVVRPTAVVLRVVARLFAVKVLQRDAFVAGLTRMADELAAETEKYVTKIGDSLGPPGLASRVAGPDAPDSNDVNPSGQTSDDRADGSGSGESETEEISGVRPGGADSAPLSRRPSSVHGRSAHHQKRAAIGRASVAIYRGLAALLSTYTDLRLEDFVAQMQLLADQSAAAAASAGARDSAVSSTAPLATAAQTLPPTASALAAAAAADAAADAGAVAGPNAVSAATAELPAAFATAATALRELVTANSHMQVASSQTHKSAAAILKRRAKGLSVGTQPVAGAVEGNIGSSSAREGGDYGYLLALFDVLLDARGHSGHRYGDDSGKNKVSGPRGGADQRTPGAAEAEPSTVNTRPTSAGDQPASDQAPAKKPLKPRHVGGLVQPTTAFLMAVADLVAEGALRTEAVSARLTSLANQLAAEAAAMATKYKAQMEAAAARYSGQPGAMAGRGPEAAAADLDAAAGEADGPGGRVSGDEREGEAADDKANAASEGHTKEPKRRHLGPSPKWWALFAEQQAALAKGSEAIYRALDTYLLTHRDRQPAALAQELRTLVRRAGGGTTGGSTGAAAAAGADAAAAAGPAVAAAAAAATAAEPDASAQPLPVASCPAAAADTPDAGAAAGAAVRCGGAVLSAPAATAGSVAASAALSALLVAHPFIQLAPRGIYKRTREKILKPRRAGRSMDGAADTEADGRDIGGLDDEGDSDLRALIRVLLVDYPGGSRQCLGGRSDPCSVPPPRDRADQHALGTGEAEPPPMDTSLASARDRPAGDQAPAKMRSKPRQVLPTTAFLMVIADLVAEGALRPEAASARLTSLANQLAAETAAEATKHKARTEAAAARDSGQPGAMAGRGPEEAAADLDAAAGEAGGPGGRVSGGEGEGEAADDKADAASEGHTAEPKRRRSVPPQWQAALAKGSEAIYRALDTYLLTHRDRQPAALAQELRTLVRRAGGDTTGGSTGAAADAAAAAGAAVAVAAAAAAAATAAEPDASAQPLPGASCPAAAADTPGAGAVAGAAVGCGGAVLFAPAATAGSVAASAALSALLVAHPSIRLAPSAIYRSTQKKIQKQRCAGRSIDGAADTEADGRDIGGLDDEGDSDLRALIRVLLVDYPVRSRQCLGGRSDPCSVPPPPRDRADQHALGTGEAEPPPMDTSLASARDRPAGDQAPAKKQLKPRHVGGQVLPTTAYLMVVADLVAEGALRPEAASIRLTYLANQLAAETAAEATKHKAWAEAAAARDSGRSAGEAGGPGGRVSGDEREGEAADDKADAASEGHTKEPKRRRSVPLQRWIAYAEQQAALAKGSEAIYRALDTYLLTHRDRHPAALAQELRTLVRRAGGGTTGGSTGAAAAAGADAAAAAGPAVAAAAAAATAAEPDASAQPLPGASCPATAADTPDAGAAAGAAVGCGGAVLFAPAATAGSVAASAALSALLVAHPSIRLATKVIYHNYRQRHKKQRPVGRSMDGAADTEADGRDIGGLGEEGDSDLRAFIRSLLLPRHVAKGAKAARGVDGSLEAAAAAMDTDKSDKAPAEAVDNDKSLEEAAEAVDLVMMALHGPLGVPLNRGLGAYIGNPGLLLPERGSDLDARLATVCRFLLPSGPGGGTECSQSTGHTLKVRFGCGVCAACRDPLAADPCLRPLTASSASGRGEASRQALLGAMGWDPASTYTAAADAGCVDNAGGRKRLGKQAPRVEQQEEVEHGEGAGGTDAAGRAPKRQRRDAATTSLDRGVDADPVGVAGTAAAGDGDGGGDEIEGRMEVSGGDAVSSGEEEASLPLAHRLRQLQMMQARRRPQRPQEQQQEQQDGPLPRVTNIFAVGAPDGCVVVPPSCGIFPRAIALDGMRLDGESAKIIAAELWLLIDLAVRARAVELQLDERLETKAALRGVRQPRLFYKHRARMMRGHVVYGAEAYVHANNAPAAAGAAGRRLPGWFGRLGPNRAVPQHVRKLLLVEQPQALVQAAQVVHAADLDMVALNEPLPRTAGGLGRVCPWCGHAGHHLRIFCPLRRLCAPSLGTFALQQQRQQQQVRPREAKRRRLGDQQPAVHQQHHQQGGSQLAVAAEAAALNPALAPHAPSLDLLMDAALLPRRQLLPPGSIPKSQAEAEAAEPMLRLLLSAPDAAAAQAGSGSAGLPFSWAATARVEEEEEEPAREAEGQRAAAAPGERAGLRNAVARGPGPPPAWLALLDPTTLDLMAAIDQAHPWAVGMQPVRRIEMGAGGADGAGAAAGAAAAAAEVDGSGLTSARWRVAPGPEPLSYEVLLMLALLMEESMKLQLTGEQALLEGKLPGARRAEGA
ncbi:hypothetical protein PLESTM_001299300 [Pleodorina starrii]|nr:hypothetical protein PLESTM_001299300 [Pleodorina starrii]